MAIGGIGDVGVDLPLPGIAGDAAEMPLHVVIGPGQHGAVLRHEAVILIRLAAGQRQDHQLALQRADVKARLLGGLHALGKSRARQAGGQKASHYRAEGRHGRLFSNIVCVSGRFSTARIAPREAPTKPSHFKSLRSNSGMAP
jgi:hypothetical protein